MHEATQIWETGVWFPEPSHDEKRDLPLIAIPKPLRRSGSVLNVAVRRLNLGAQEAGIVVCWGHVLPLIVHSRRNPAA